MDKFTSIANKILAERVYENQYAADENEEDLESKVFALVKAGKNEEATDILSRLRFSDPQKFKSFLNKINNMTNEIEDAASEAAKDVTPEAEKDKS